MAVITGNCWTFDDDVNTDAMAPGGSMSMDWELRRFTLFPDRPDFAGAVAPGDIIVAGQNWGCGSSREQAVHNLLNLQVAAVIAESFGRIFFRNAIANALPVIVCPGVSSAIAEGDIVEFDWDDFSVTNQTSGKALRATPYTGEMREIVQAGGMIELLKKRQAKGGWASCRN